MRSFLRMGSSLPLLLTPVLASALGIQVMIDGRAVVFEDVPQSAWFATHVQQAAEAGIVTGYRDNSGQLTGKYGPSNSITMAEALKIAVEGAGYDTDDYGSTVDASVGSHWAAPYVAVAKTENFTIVPRRTQLDRPATRAEVAALFTSAFGVDTETPVGNNYDDVTFSTEHSFAIEALSRDGVVSGDTDIDGKSLARFRPTDRINRAEVAKIVIRAREEYQTPGEGKKPDEGNVDTVEDATVTYNDMGFSPQVLRVKKGTSVTFKNEGSVEMWVASNPHPSHTALSSFDAQNMIGQGESYSYTFTMIGSWAYHNHMAPSHGGMILVEE